MKTIGEIIQLSADYLSKRGIASPRRQAEELLAHALRLPRIELYLQFDRPLEESELGLFRAFLKKRGQKMPIPYIVGQVLFLDCMIEVNSDVLIPRPETEFLADQVLKDLDKTPAVIWDLCAGCGCLGIAIKKRRPDCQVILSDLSPSALEVASRNASRNRVDVEVRTGDLTLPFIGNLAHVVVCNPPYVTEHDYLTLDPEVREWEPKMALVGGSTGYEFYERLNRELPPLLHPRAKVYFEIGTGMGEKMKNIFTNNMWSSVIIMKDLASHDRYVHLVRAN